MEFRLPTNKQRVAVFGRTGSGKTQFGAWLLSKAPFDAQPYVIVDYKGDELLNDIEGIREIGFGEIPKHPGLYIIHPIPQHDDERLEQMFWGIWRREKIGVYVDEGYALPNDGKSDAFTAILTQGRSKKIPAIVLSQRPVKLNKCVFTEADFYAAFHLNDKTDMRRCSEFMPPDINWGERLEKYTCRWYDVGEDALFRLQPVPSADDLLDVFWERLKPKRGKI